MKTILITIDEEDSGTTVATSGFQGAECLKATEAQERALGLKTSDQKTGEFHRRTNQHLRQGS